MKKKQLIGLVIAAALFIVTGVSSVLVNSVADQKALAYTDMLADMENTPVFDPPAEEYIAIVKVEGTIQEQQATGILEQKAGYLHSDTMTYIDELMGDENNRGILLYVDSPGGTVYESEELYQKLQEYKETTGNPIWGYMAHYAASGGYMASMAADKIYANKNTTTGSIGVIMSGYDMTGLYEKLGIHYVSITSGENKDSSRMTEEQIAIYQEQIDECYENFVDIVEEGRGMSEEEVKALADGRTYTALQAEKNGLIDEISSYEEMQTAMSDELGVSQYYLKDLWESNPFASLLVNVKDLMPKSEAQILKETAAEMESGVPMYYAEHLQ